MTIQSPSKNTSEVYKKGKKEKSLDLVTVLTQSVLDTVNNP